MRGFGIAAGVAGLLVGLASAQSSVTPTLAAGPTYQPAVPWTQGNGPCSAGSTATATGGYGGGVYQDIFGGYWEIECGFAWSSTQYYAAEGGPGSQQAPGTAAQGMYACANGCAQRPGCVAYEFFGTTSGPHSGSGKCV